MTQAWKFPLLKLLFACVLLSLLSGCTITPEIIESDPVAVLGKLPAGFSYTTTQSSAPFIYQRSIGEVSYEFESCDSVIGIQEYKDLMDYMKRYDVHCITISDDGKYYVLETIRHEDQFSVDAFVFAADGVKDDEFAVKRANALLPAGTPITQHLQLNESWLRVTMFDHRRQDYLFSFE